jgi:hypothetical protein
MRPSLRGSLATAGALVAGGFLTASAIMNYLFGASLGRTPLEAKVYGAVSVLAVLCNALSPFFLSWGWQGKRYGVAAASALLWSLCLVYCVTSALGFAAENRIAIAGARETVQANYETASRHLLQLEARRAAHPSRDLDERVERLRREVADLRAQGGMRETDPQAELLSRITFGMLEKRQVRFALVALFALMVEAGAALGLFAALAHLSELPKVHVAANIVSAKRVPAAPTRWLPPAQRKKSADASQ